jgi:hypothetical protein
MSKMLLFLATAGGANEQDVALLKFYLVLRLRRNAFVMVIDGDREHLFGAILTYHPIVELVVNLLGGQNTPH